MGLWLKLPVFQYLFTSFVSCCIKFKFLVLIYKACVFLPLPYCTSLFSFSLQQQPSQPSLLMVILIISFFRLHAFAHAAFCAWRSSHFLRIKHSSLNPSLKSVSSIYNLPTLLSSSAAPPLFTLTYLDCCLGSGLLFICLVYLKTVSSLWLGAFHTLQTGSSAGVNQVSSSIGGDLSSFTPVTTKI